MKNINEKAVYFVAALADVYRDEEDRELGAFSPIEFGDDVTDDFTAMLIAMKVTFEGITGIDGDLIDFTHILNKLAIQYIMDGDKDA